MKKILMKNPACLPVHEVDDFLLDCEIRGLSPATIKTYKEKLAFYCKLYDFSQDSVGEFIVNQLKEGKSKATINSTLRVIKVYCTYAEIPVDIKFIKEEDKIKDIYTDDEIRKLIKKPTNCNFTEFKVWALTNFLIGTGARISTALEVKVEDIDFNSGLILFRHEKNHTQQYFPLSKALEVVLKQYIRVRGNSGYLFCNIYGEKSDRSSIQKLTSKYNRDRGVNKTSLHLYRHTFAVNYIRNGGEIYQLMRLLGHKNIEMSMHYAKVYGNDLNYQLDVRSPLDLNQKNIIKMTRKNTGLTSGVLFINFYLKKEIRVIFPVFAK